MPHHPIYYLDFPDLKKLIQRADNWRDIFGPVLKNKEIFIATLTELAPIRNKIAHNRKTTKGDLKIIEAAYEKISSTIGDSDFNDFISRCTSAEDIPTSISTLIAEAEAAVRTCSGCEALTDLDVWHKIDGSWWFDEDYLGHRLSNTRSYFEILKDYRELPRTRGAGYRIKTWLKSNQLEEKYEMAKQELLSIMSELSRP